MNEETATGWQANVTVLQVHIPLNLVDGRGTRSISKLVLSQKPAVVKPIVFKYGNNGYDHPSRLA